MVPTLIETEYSSGCSGNWYVQHGTLHGFSLEKTTRNSSSGSSVSEHRKYGVQKSTRNRRKSSVAENSVVIRKKQKYGEKNRSKVTMSPRPNRLPFKLVFFESLFMVVAGNVGVVMGRRRCRYSSLSLFSRCHFSSSSSSSWFDSLHRRFGIREARSTLGDVDGTLLSLLLLWSIGLCRFSKPFCSSRFVILSSLR